MNSRSRTLAALARLGLPSAAILLLGPRLKALIGRFHVRGESMRPTLDDGDIVVGLMRRRWTDQVRAPQVGDIVAVHLPWEPDRIGIKRIVAGPGEAWIDLDGSSDDGNRVPPGPGWVVVGDQRVLSTDSRHHGRVADRDVEAIILYRVYPEDRSGRISLRPEA